VKVLIVSKALVRRAYRQKLTELARLGVEVHAVAPQEWREDGLRLPLEPGGDDSYELVVSPIRWNGRFHLHYYPQLPRLIRSIRPDLLHMDEEPYNLATHLGVGAAHHSAVPSLFFTWQNLFRRYPPPFSRMEQTVYRRVVHALAGSEEAAGVLRRKGYGGQITIVPQFGVDPETFSPGKASHQHFTIGFLNRLVPAKGPPVALEAVERLPADCALRIVGDGPLRPALQTEIARRGLQGRVSVEPPCPSTDVPDLLRSLDVVILPSLTTPRWKEQFGRVLVEAMACGIPVVGSDSGEIPRVVGDAGLIVPEGDADALAEAIRSLYEDDELRVALGRRGRQRILEHFTHERVARLTYEAYCRVLAG
jgi:glycosyltransferase involved in cell wall biosynthesis